MEFVLKWVDVADSPYRDTISMAILHLQEGGRLQMLYNKWWKNAGKCSGDEKQAEKKQSSLGVANVGGTFVILVAGLAMAAVVAVIEFVWYNTRTTHHDGDHGHQVYFTDEDMCTMSGDKRAHDEYRNGGVFRM